MMQKLTQVSCAQEVRTGRWVVNVTCRGARVRRTFDPANVTAAAEDVLVGVANQLPAEDWALVDRWRLGRILELTMQEAVR